MERIVYLDDVHPTKIRAYLDIADELRLKKHSDRIEVTLIFNEHNEEGEEYKQEEEHEWYVSGGYKWYVSGTVEYAIDKKRDLIRIRRRNSTWRYTIEYSKAKKIFDMLPDRATSKDVIESAREIGIKMRSDSASALMRVFCYVDFNAEVIKEGKHLILIKYGDEGLLREEVKRKLKQELEVIGTGL